MPISLDNILNKSRIKTAAEAKTTAAVAVYLLLQVELAYLDPVTPSGA